MGPGGFQDAEFPLVASVPAGAYHLVCDSIVIRAVDVTFDLFLRRDGVDTTLATQTRHFDPLPNGQIAAQPCEVDLDAPAIDHRPGDQLVWRYTGANTTAIVAWIPNGDGPLADGNIPNLTLPR